MQKRNKNHWFQEKTESTFEDTTEKKREKKGGKKEDYFQWIIGTEEYFQSARKNIFTLGERHF